MGNEVYCWMLGLKENCIFIWLLQFLDKMQGLPWIIAERLPLFVQSDCYFEYRWGKHTNFCCFNTQKLVEKPMQSKVSDTHTILCMCSILVSSSYQGRDNRLLLRCIHLSPSELFWMVSVNLEYWIMSLLRVLEPSQSYEWSPKFLILN